MNLLKQKAILLVVFLTGACVLVIEVIAIRILSPYFGNTIYSYSSVLGVVLAALSLGYYFGGKFADKHPEYKHFFSIISLSSITVLAVLLLVIFVLPNIAYQFPYTSGPLFLSIILFGIPSYLLGMLSPYGVTLHAKNNPDSGAGNVAGEVFFVSTLGSIAGSLITGFYLIPYFGIQTILVGVSIALLLIGFIGLYVTKSLSPKLFILLFFSLLLLSITKDLNAYTNKNVIHVEDGVYERLAVFDSEYRGRPARMLIQDRSSASAIDTETGKLVFEYAQYANLYKVTKTPSNILLIGGGTYTMPKVWLEETEKTIIDVVEIEPKLYNLAKTYYGLTENPRLQNHVTDGRRYLHDTDTTYDFIYGDAYSSIYALPSHLVTREFFELAKSKMNEDALLVINVIGRLRNEDQSLALSFLKTFTSVFPNTYVFAARDPQSEDTQNLLFVAYNSEKMIDINSDKLIDYVTGTPIRLDKQLVDTKRFDLTKQILFTDDYSPTDLFGVHLLTENKKRTSSASAKMAFSYIKAQIDMGPRYPGSPGQTKFGEFLENEAKSGNYNVLIQPFTHSSSKGNFRMNNFVVQYKPDETNKMIIGTHFDSKRLANLDKVNKNEPVPGANDGASGTAVMLAIMAMLKNNEFSLPYGIDFVFFDGEEAEDIKDGPWIPLGSTHFAQNIRSMYPNDKPKEGIVLDMVCDRDLTIHREANSDTYARNTNDRFFAVATRKYPSIFSSDIKYVITDDHMPLNKIGIPTILLIDYDYPYWHTTEDTIDKCSEENLGKVVDTLVTYLKTK